ncbi:YlbG family protein [Alkalibacterium iburiense]|uniref:YlbG family protein n=1 Tax=Alkalibacterium iburiense TaxID=290589 RepID=A0ABN0XK51_9LACT
MEERKSERVGIVVWLYTTKYINKLKRYGLVHYVSKKMNYAIIYVDRKDRESISHTISKQHFVRQVEDSHSCDIPKTFDGILEKVEELTLSKKEEAVSKEVI